MAIIAFGRIEKKLYLILLLVIIDTVRALISKKVPEEYSTYFLSEILSKSGSIIISIIIYFIHKQKDNKSTRNKKHVTRKSFKYLIILFIIRAIDSCFDILYDYFIEEKKYDYNSIGNTLNVIAIIFFTTLSFLLLKYKYYIHHIISIVIFCILCISCDFILGNYSNLNFKYVYIFIIGGFNVVAKYCFIKYMIDNLYYHYNEILLYHGIFAVIVEFILFLLLSIYENKNEINKYFNSFKTYFQEANIWIIIFYQFFYYIFSGGLHYLFFILILFYLNPNHYIFYNEIIVYEKILILGKNTNRFYTLIIFVFQILSLLFYFEILEFKFWNLNKNTIRNIQIREGEEGLLKNRSTSTMIELENDLYIKNEDFKSSNGEDVDSNEINN